ncbi:MAG: DegV family EDD domain-containing protein [Gammaproteobacteria bacterium]|nr:DegV family EDD domain-containing protein [Gammaproteobacteria bacterium]
MTVHSSKIIYLDGTRLYRAIVAGIRQVISKQEYLNSINVFPVPDRDTGTNMALTLNAILEGTYARRSITIHELLESVANSALNGARGNSGAILAQFFQGLSEGAKTVNKVMTTKNFVAAIATAVNYAHKALSQPKEGTILTILRDFSDEITHQQLENNELDFVDLLYCGIQRAKKALQHTTMQLKELKNAGVVDAGAQGFVEFLNGIYQFVVNGSIKQLQEDLVQIPIIESHDEMVHEIDERFRFCTECLINKCGDKLIDQDELRQRLDEIGESLIVAGSGIKTKIHIHTNDPGAVFSVCREYGDTSGEKADDMIKQQKSYANRKSTVAILTDSAADLPSEVISKYNIHVVPILINFGQQTYLDKVSMTSEEFHQALKSKSAHPTTSQPSFGDFHRQYQYLSTHFDAIIALHVPRSVSGTLSASEKASEKLKEQTQITVIDTLNVSAGQGLIALYAAEASLAGRSHDDIVKMTNDIIYKTEFYAAITQLDFLVHGGRLPIKLKYFMDFFKLTPLVTVNNEGKVKPHRLLFGRKNLSCKLFKFMKNRIDPNKKYRFSVVHADLETEAYKLATLIKQQFADQIDEIYILPCCASLAVHAGPGALGIAIQEYTAPTAA